MKKGEINSDIPTREEVDEFEQKFRNVLHQHLGNDLPEVHFDLKPIGQHTIVRIDIEASSFPVFYQEQLGDRKTC